MTLHIPADTMPGLDAVTDADREWFLARPSRRYRLRPTAIAELPPGETMEPGQHTVVVLCGSPLVRMRVHVGRPPLRLRQDTDRCCRELIQALDAAGCRINGKQLLPTITELSRDVGDILRGAEGARCSASEGWL